MSNPWIPFLGVIVVTVLAVATAVVSSVSSRRSEVEELRDDAEAKGWKIVSDSGTGRPLVSHGELAHELADSSMPTGGQEPYAYDQPFLIRPGPDHFLPLIADIEAYERQIAVAGDEGSQEVTAALERIRQILERRAIRRLRRG